MTDLTAHEKLEAIHALTKSYKGTNAHAILLQIQKIMNGEPFDEDDLAPPRHIH